MIEDKNVTAATMPAQAGEAGTVSNAGTDWTQYSDQQLLALLKPPKNGRQEYDPAFIDGVKAQITKRGLSLDSSNTT